LHRPGGLVEIGHGGDAFSFDNERPRHTALVRPYEIANRLVTNAANSAFVADGGYARPEYWLSDGWATVQ
ncbi:ergothioneine biosynthesis protein EgtB, partial [Burkholderia multivorans]